MNIRRLLLATIMGVILILTILPALAQDTGVTVNATTLTRVRSGPGTTYSIVGFLVEGDSFSATGRDSTSNDWLRIDYDGEEGWVAASVVNVDGDPTTLSIVTAASAESVVGNTDATITTEDTVNVRVGPGTTYRVIDQLDSGTTFDVTGRTAISFPLVCRGSSIIDPTEGDSLDNVWLRINLGGFSAWVAYAAVSTDGNICDVDVISSDEAVSTPEGL
ncbi:MAG: SH3 domain-containing protein, partial [Chitinophagaceae bacterium]|nr:SH3 domain-containing protein [Anaerolineae bacterium]